MPILYFFFFLGSFIGGLFSSLTGGNQKKLKPDENQGFMHKNPPEKFRQDIAEERFLKPPLNPAYAAQLQLLSTLPLRQRLEYIKAGLLRTSARFLQDKGNLFNQNADRLRNQANDLYSTRPPPPPPTPRPGNLDFVFQ